MTEILWALVLGAYALGYLVAMVVIFRMFAADKVMGVHTADSPGEAVGLIVLGGMVAMIFALLWPLMAVALLVYRFAVAPKRGQR